MPVLSGAIIRNGGHMGTGITIENVEPGSIAAELEIEAGDRLLAINGQPIRDIIDFGYYSAEEDFSECSNSPNLSQR